MEVKIIETPILKKPFIIAGLMILLCVIWFSWVSVSSIRTAKIEDKIRGLLTTGLQIAATDTPRVMVNNDGGFYGPDLNNSQAVSKIYPAVYMSILDGLQASTTPFCKVETIRMDTDYISKLNAYAIVTFEVFPGIVKRIFVTASIKAPKYKNITELEEITKPAP